MRQVPILFLAILFLGCATAEIHIPAHTPKPNVIPEMIIDATAFGQSKVVVKKDGDIEISGGPASDGIVSGWTDSLKAVVSFFRGQPPVINVTVPNRESLEVEH